MDETVEIDELLAEVREQLVRVARFRIREAADVEDVVHKTVVTVVEQYRNGFKARNFVNWVFGVFAICLNDYYRNKANQRAVPISQAERMPSLSNPEEFVLAAEREEQLVDAFKRLSNEEIDIVKGLIYGATHEELAHHLKCSKNALYTRIHRTRKKLEKFVPWLKSVKKKD